MVYTEEMYSYPNYPEMRADFSLPSEYYDRFTEDDHAVWRHLYDRQMKLVQDYACEDYLEALHRLPMNGDRIPRFEEINAMLYKATGWELVAVPGLIPVLPFFNHLATQAFPVTHWIRSRAKIDYLQEPDLFHDLFGHVPLLMIPQYADYMSAYGRGGCRAFRMGNETYVEFLQRLYWYTVEFGLIEEKGKLKIYGAGILSSPGEVVFSVDSDSPNRIYFDMERIMLTDFIISDYQQTYWVIEAIDQLFKETQQDFKPIYQKLEQKLSQSGRLYAPGEVIAEDRVMNVGTASYHRAKAS
jgi:phenylalanine-4-hydroxylase